MHSFLQWTNNNYYIIWVCICSLSLWVFLNTQLTFIKSQQRHNSENRTARKSHFFYHNMPIP